ncbi:class I SAM-dependent methyltransferase [Actinoplanes xinjiangensis]|uniref:Methyltransferase family protein n=1 Tax=Actinoplanes xinjiangensis TaxID=512350 RepID=A0A316FIH3_9ACTN|nr:class I SAM-dependent methyltransferase [Actinoplanes xinjiangensis]PWK48279.1 methyltransferase family protein [Actinoplanes xinjiangensis]
MASSPPAVPVLDRTAVDRWRRAWDEVMAGFLPGAASFEHVLPAVVEAVCGGAPRRILDLGGGPGVFAERMAGRWPGAEVAMMDLDPVLLALAGAGADGRVRVHRGDLTSSWCGEVGPDGPYDLLTIVMTIHYLTPGRALALYRAARSVLRPGGLLIVADLMPEAGLDRVTGSLPPAAGLAWERWWDEVRADGALRQLLDERRAVFAGRVPAEFTPPADWHRSAALRSGFEQAGVVWRWGAHAALAAIA